MESYGKVAITITTKQRASIAAAIQPKVCAEVCHAFDETEGIGYTFRLALTEALEQIGISLQFEDLNEETAAYKLIISHKESLALEDLRAEVWQKEIMAPRSVPDIVNQMLDASIHFLGIKVKRARVKTPQKPAKERPRLRAA